MKVTAVIWTVTHGIFHTITNINNNNTKETNERISTFYKCKGITIYPYGT